MNLSYIDDTYNDFGCSQCSGRGMDRISKEITPLGTIDYTYDKDGRRITMLVAGQPIVNYIYDDAGRMTSMNRKIGTKTRTHTFTFDNANRRTQLKLAISQANKYVTTTYGYDIANRLLSMLIQGPTVQIENLVYTYDANANKASFTRNATQPVREGITNATYNSANEMLTFTPVTSPAKTMTYDNNGNLLTVTNNCGTTTYTWDVRNRLSGISGFKSDCTSLTASFQYDAIGRRIQKTINGTTTQYLYDGLDIIQEKNQSGAVTANYIRTLNIDEPLTRIKADGTVRHYVTDALGSIIALTDDSGVVKTTYTYDPFGNVTVTGEATDNPFQFVAKENDGTDLIREGFRYYSTELQRYISEDLIRLAGGDVNFYVRTSNDPVNYIDPLGLAMITYNDPTGLIEGIKHGQESGYDDCFRECLAGYLTAPLFALLGEEGILFSLKHYAGSVSKFFHTIAMPNPSSMLDVKIYLKTLAPSFDKGMQTFSRGVTIVSFAYFYYKTYDCAKDCMKCL